MNFQLSEFSLESAPWQQIQPLLDSCYPSPPRDVFTKVLSGSHIRQRLWLAQSPTGEWLGMVMLSPHSKGGHLENLAVIPAARGKGVGQALVMQLLSDVSSLGPAIVSLTTRVPTYFEFLGFRCVGQLTDNSKAMVIFLPTPITSTDS